MLSIQLYQIQIKPREYYQIYTEKQIEFVNMIIGVQSYGDTVYQFISFPIEKQNKLWFIT